MLGACCLIHGATAAAGAELQAQHSFGLADAFHSRGSLDSGLELSEEQRSSLAKLVAEGGLYRVQVQGGAAGSIMAAVNAVSELRECDS